MSGFLNFNPILKIELSFEEFGKNVTWLYAKKFNFQYVSNFL